MEKIQSIDASVIKFVMQSVYPMSIRDLNNGVHLLVNPAWDDIIGTSTEGKTLSDIANDDPIVQTNLMTCGVFDSLIQDQSLILNETFGYNSYMVHRSPIIYKNKRCIIIQVMTL
jgi:hypothetical protein